MKTIIIEPTLVLRRYVRRLLNEQFEHQRIQLYEAEETRQAMVLIRGYNPQCIIVGSGVNPIRFSQEVWHEHPGMSMLFWLSRQHDYKIRHILNHKPAGTPVAFVLQSSPAKQLVIAIKSLQLGKTLFLDPAISSNKTAVSAPTILTDEEYEVLGDVIFGLTDKAISLMRNISVRTVQHRIGRAAEKMRKDDWNGAYNKDQSENVRVRIAIQALRDGIFQVEDLVQLEESYKDWLDNTQSKQESKKLLNALNNVASSETRKHSTTVMSSLHEQYSEV